MNIQIAQLDRTLPDGCVTTIHWTATQTDGDFTASAYGSLGVPAKDPSDPTFIAFDDLTEEQVKQWCLETMGEEQVAALQANLDGQINAARFPTSASGLPWASAPVSVEPEEESDAA
jgi:hypothetical protein